MSETPSSPPSSPTTKEAEIKKSTNNIGIKKFEGDGLPFKGKLIGMEDLSVDRDEKICLDSMFKLKAVVRARGEHKQRIQLNLTMSAVKVIDDTTKVQIASHEIERISFVVIDPRDTRAFGYIYNTSDDRHQFWAIKTERAAAATVLALKELFELAFEQYTNDEKAKAESNKPVVTTPTSPSAGSIETQVPQPAAPVSSPSQPPTISEPAQPTPVSSPPPPPPAAEPSQPNLLDDLIWGEPAPTTTVSPSSNQSTVPDLFGLNEPVVPVTQPAPPSRTLDPLEDLFSGLSTTTPTQPSFTSPLFSNPAPPPANPYANIYAQPTQSNLLTATPISSQQQRPLTPTTTPTQQQSDLLSASPVSPVAPATVTSPFADLDIFGGLSSPASGKTTKDAFFPAAAPKTIQQMQLEKQS